MEVLSIGTMVVSTLYGGPATLISTISKTTQGVLFLMRCIEKKEGRNPNSVIAELNKMDIEATIRIVELLIKDIDKTGINVTILKCIEYIKDIIDEIYREIDKIYAKVKYNKSLWFLNSVRSYDCNQHLQNVSANEKKLRNRLDLLLNIFTIYKINVNTTNNTININSALINVDRKQIEDKEITSPDNKIKLLEEDELLHKIEVSDVYIKDEYIVGDYNTIM